jgi:hypothetical protein
MRPPSAEDTLRRELDALRFRLAMSEAETIGLRDLLREVRDTVGRGDGRISGGSSLMARITAAIAEDLR